MNEINCTIEQMIKEIIRVLEHQFDGLERIYLFKKRVVEQIT